jgi:hypothetical protein
MLSFLFHIDDHSWYSTYFHAYDGGKELTETEQELNLPFLSEAVTQAYELGRDEDGESAEDLFTEINDPLVDAIVEGWIKAGGSELMQPAYIYPRLLLLL